MSQALGVLDRAIRGDPACLSFLEQTTSLYVLDAATMPGHPRTYGWWDFLNDALNDVERHESENDDAMTGLGGMVGGGGGRHIDDDDIRHRRRRMRNLDAHVRLLATITRRVARRSPSHDRRLVITCLANASVGRDDDENDHARRTLLVNNDELRERNMGRIASIVFDYAYHHRRHHHHHPPPRGATTDRVEDDDADIHDDIDGRQHRPHHRSAFSDTIAMEQLCGALASNAISSGPYALRHLVCDWMVPCADALPNYAVAVVMYYIGTEANESRDVPAGTIDVLRSLLPSVFRDALGPILIRSLRMGDDGDDDSMVESRGMVGECGIIGGGGRGGDGGDGHHHRTIASFAMRSLDSWCRANSIGAVKLRGIFSRTNINILEAIASALSSNAKIMLDAVSDLVETLLQNDAADAKISLGMSIVESVMGSNVPAGVADQLLVAQQVTGENEKSRILVLSELVSAVGSQRFRFAERQANGDTAVCRCLARTAANVLLESQGLMQNGALQPSMNGLLDLLFKAASHPSVYVCGIAVEALAVIVPSNSELSTRLLPHLQGKAILPHHLMEDASEGLEEYINFRDRVLTDALVACFTGCGKFYMESCGSAIEEFVQASPSPQLPYQLEAALFCIVAVLDRASKRSINPTSNSVANVLIDPKRRSKMRELWNEVLASLVEAGRRPAEETTMWIQRRVIDAIST